MTRMLTRQQKIEYLALREERQRRDLLKAAQTNSQAIRADCATLAGFIKHAWPVLEPRAPLTWSWHMDAICQHLEAVSDGRINRLLINVPPGSSKSLIVSVFWPAWEWARGSHSMRYLATSFNDGPVKRDTRKMRDLVASPWFATLWPEARLTRTGETSFANNHTGTREGMAFGSLTSQRGDRLIIDDPHSTETAESETEREKTTRKFREGALDRLNDLERSAIVVIMQRLHETDVSGVIESLPELGFCHLVIPMEYDAELAVKYCPTAIGWIDPRTTEGELMDPVRFGATAVHKMKVGKGAYAWASQYQQRPGPRGGAIFQKDWWQYYRPEALPPIIRVIQSWDTAFKDKTKNDPSSCTTWAECTKGYFLLHRHNSRMQYPLLRQMAISLAAKTWGDKPVHAVLIEDKASGQSLIQDLRNTKIPIVPVQVDGDKMTRAFAVTGVVESGRVYLPEGEPWLEEYLQQLGAFPTGAHDDDVDSTTQALAYLHLNAGRNGFIDWVRSEQAADDDEDD